MKLSDALSASQATPVVAQSTLHLSGVIEADTDPSMFRVFTAPEDKRSYLLVQRSDVVGDLYEWTPQELTQASVVGAKVHRIPIRHGATVLEVSVAVHRLGETLAADDSLLREKVRTVGVCRHTSGCGTKKCCTTGSDGKCYCDNCCIG